MGGGAANFLPQTAPGSKRKDDRESEARDEWKDTVMDALVASAAFRKEHENDPEKRVRVPVVARPPEKVPEIPHCVPPGRPVRGPPEPGS